MKAVTTNRAPAAIGPYNQAIIENGFVFLSGQIPLVPETGELAAGGVKEQAEQVMKNIGAILEEAGSSFEQAVKTTCFLVSMDDFATFNEVYAKYFTGKPARSCFAVVALPRGASVEVEVVAKVVAGN